MKPLKNVRLEKKLPRIYIRFRGFSFDVRKIKVVSMISKFESFHFMNLENRGQIAVWPVRASLSKFIFYSDADALLSHNDDLYYNSSVL